MPYDVFISYSRRDNEHGRLTELIERLEAAYETVTGRPLLSFFDVTEIKGMDDWRHRILQALRDSRVLIACLSPRYVSSPNCEWEFNEYLKSEVRRFPSEGVAPFYIADINHWNSDAFEHSAATWVAELRRRQYFDIRGWFAARDLAARRGPEDGAFDAAAAQIRDRLSRGRRAERSPGNVDAPNPHFVGRATELRRLRETVAFRLVGVLTAVHGLGGVGKTALAIEYAHVFAHEYGGGRWQVRCEGKARLHAAIAGLAAPLGLDGHIDSDAGVDSQFERVLQELWRRASVSSPSRCLLILDNVDDAGLLQPAETQRLPAADWLHVIATTRLGEDAFGGACQARAFVSVDELRPEDAVELIESYQRDGHFRDEVEREAATEIVRLLGGFALAVEAAAVYLGEFAGDVTCASFCARLKSEGLETLDSAAVDSAARVRHREKRLSVTLEPTLDKLEAPESLAVSYAALLPADHVPLAWLRALVAQRFPAIGTDAAPGYPDPWSRLLRRLTGFRLLQPTGAEATAKMHRVVQTVIKRSLPDDVLEARRSTLGAHIERVQREIEDRIEQHHPKHSTFRKIDARHQEALNDLQVVLNLQTERLRWHPKAAEHFKNLGAIEDYSEVYCFPCCGKYVVVDSSPPSQWRLDGCESAP